MSRPSRITAAAREIWREIVTPSASDEAPYLAALIAIGHVMLGAALSWGAVASLAGYWLVKERADLRRGGGLKDSLIDASFVALGIAYPGPIWWPVAAFASVAAMTIWRATE